MKMTTNRHSNEDAHPLPSEAEVMACVLEGRHGRFAAEVAEFFSSLHTHQGNTMRSHAWAAVAQMVRERELDRLEDTSRP